MTKRFKHKNYIHLIMMSLISIIALLLIIVSFIPPMPGYERGSIEKVALNFAATVAQRVGVYYSETDSIWFIGLKTGFEGDNIGKDILNFRAPRDYSCEILDSLVIVTHKDGAKAKVSWR